MNLQEHLDLLGLEPYQLAHTAQVDKKIVKRVLEGQPIIVSHAERIAQALNTHHGLHATHKDRISHEDIDGLQVIATHELKGKGAAGDGSGTGMA